MTKLALPLLLALLSACSESTAADEVSAPPAEQSGEPEPTRETTTTTTPSVERPAAETPPVAVPAVSPEIAWYVDGTTTGTGSANDLGKLGVDASTVTAAQLASLIETSKYSGEPRKKDVAVVFDEVFLARAQNDAFMGKLATAVARVRADGFAKVLVYNNGPRSIAEAAPGWSAIAKAGAMVGLEAYMTTFWGDVKAAEAATPFQDAPDVAAGVAANPALYAAFQTRLAKYVADAKAQLADPSLFDHLALVAYEGMRHDVATIQKWGWTLEKATHLAEVWYAAMKDVAAAEHIRWGVYHPA